jgi:hypothetical protein
MFENCAVAQVYELRSVNTPYKRDSKVYLLRLSLALIVSRRDDYVDSHNLDVIYIQ